MNIELKPCPFCGRNPVVIKRTDTYLSGTSERERTAEEYFVIECEEYDCLFNPGTGTYETLDEALEEWNRRGKTRWE